MYICCIDAGHGGKDSGCISANNECEKNINLQVALHLKELAKQYSNSLKLIFTREDDRFIELTERAKFANINNAKLCISIHHNANDKKTRGTEVIHSILGGKGKLFANILLDEFVKLGFQKRKAYYKESTKYKGRDYFTIISDTKMPTVIAECCFVDHIDDLRLMTTVEQRKAQANAILKSILKYFNIPENSQEVAVDIQSLKTNIVSLEDKVIKQQATIDLLAIGHEYDSDTIDELQKKLQKTQQK
jgi:N-acetylmuramoyl-L-alanine amidase